MFQCPECRLGFENLGDRIRHQQALHPAYFRCPRCNKVSYNADDIAEGYCGNCHDWTGSDR
jgi:uncharacterized C2H2 Zn-finger protein